MENKYIFLLSYIGSCVGLFLGIYIISKYEEYKQKQGLKKWMEATK